MSHKPTQKLHIQEYIHNAEYLEEQYRKSPSLFKAEFDALYEESVKSPILEFWNLRLNYKQKKNYLPSVPIEWVVLLSLICGLATKIPNIFNMDEPLFFSRNVGFIAFSVLTFYFAYKHELSKKVSAIIAAITLFLIIYINFLFPKFASTSVLDLVYLHLPLLLWCLLGITFSKGKFSVVSTFGFLKYNGDMVVILFIMMISMGIVAGLAFALFSLIDLDISFFISYFGSFFIATLPIIATHILDQKAQIVSKVAPVIAKIFSPLCSVILAIYIITAIFSTGDIENDREFLRISNIVSIAVMALVTFSLGFLKEGSVKWNIISLIALSTVVVIVNSFNVGMSAWRIAEWSITPNRIALFSTNLLMIVHLIFILISLIRLFKTPSKIHIAENTIALFMPVYALWTLVVIFIFPFLFI